MTHVTAIAMETTAAHLRALIHERPGARGSSDSVSPSTACAGMGITGRCAGDMRESGQVGGGTHTRYLQQALALARISTNCSRSEFGSRVGVAQASGYRPNDRGDAALSMVNGFGADGVFKRR